MDQRNNGGIDFQRAVNERLMRRLGELQAQLIATEVQIEMLQAQIKQASTAV